MKGMSKIVFSRTSTCFQFRQPQFHPRVSDCGPYLPQAAIVPFIANKKKVHLRNNYINVNLIPTD